MITRRLSHYNQTARSGQVIPLRQITKYGCPTKLAVRHLVQHKVRQDAERLKLGSVWRDHNLVFASSVGTPIEPRNVNRRWDELRERAGLDWLRLPDLRHGCATFMMAAGIPARTIMEVPGHSEIGVTMNTYTHVLAQLREDAADAIDRVLGA